MRIIVRCHQCGPNEEAALLEVGNENLHQVICDKGHVSSLVIIQHKHEILFEVAAHAIIDGYYREAISSFSASLERYYEFFMKVISIGLPNDAFKTAWGLVSAQSERQLGGYIFMYMIVYESVPDILPQSLVKLRNNVIHKGYIPSREDAIRLGDVVAKIINDGCNLLRRTKSEELDEVIRQAICPKNESKHPVLGLPTYLNCSVEAKSIPLEEHLKSVQTHNRPRY